MKAKNQPIAKTVALLPDSAVRRRNSRGSAEKNIEELFLAELRMRRERLKELMRLLNLEVGRGPARSGAHACGRRISQGSAAGAFRTGGHAQREL
jgi:hypothetical protein